MNILITGGTGFVGGYLSRALIDAGHAVTTFGTRRRNPLEGTENFRYIKADTTEPGPWQKEVAGMDAVVNLAGRSIFHRWSPSYKELVYNSRIRTTRNLVAAISDKNPQVLVSASAVGYYGDRGDRELTEGTDAGSGFLADVAKDWESEALLAQDKGVRVVLTRFAAIMGKDGGALEKMVPVFKMMAGGPIGDGRQWFPWIHMEDVILGIRFLMENETAEGPFNFVSPGIVRNWEFAHALGKALNRPALLPAPVFMIRAALGEMASMVLSSQRCRPDRLTEIGYSFRHPDVDEALTQLVGS
jgi:uncharacterized protein